MERHLRFIWSVIARQGLLLALIAALVIVQAWWIYQRVRQTALEQAGRRQMLLAEQTARGIESYYAGIIETLDLLRRADDEEAPPEGPVVDGPPADGPPPDARRQAAPHNQRPPVPLPPPVEGPRIMLRELSRVSGRGRVTLPPGVTGTAARQVLLPVFWDQLQERVSQLFIVDKGTMRLVQSFAEPGALDAATIVEARKAWLASVEEPSVSKVGELGGRWGNMVAVPLPGGKRLICAVVPIEKVADHFLRGIHDEKVGIAPMLLDEAGRVLHCDAGMPAGRSIVADAGTPALQRMIVETLAGTKPAVHVLEGTQRLAEIEFDGALITVHPVEVPNGRWWLSISSTLESVDAFLLDMYRRVLIFSAVAIGLFTLVFVRIGVGQIRERARLERVKHDLLAREIEQARRIQLAWLPRAEARIGGAEVSAVNRPANHISGDFYNWFDLSEGRSVVLIGDVTGHGMAAAFLMATTQLLARAAMQRLDDPARALTAVNRELCQQVFSGQFVTMMIVLLDPERGVMQVATAGHPPAVIARAGDGRSTLLSIDSQLVLGVDPEWTYQNETITLNDETTLLLYTDGVVEAESEDGRRFEDDGLLECLGEGVESPSGMIRRVLAAVDRFRGSKDLADDVTVVAVRIAAVEARTQDVVGVL